MVRAGRGRYAVLGVVAAAATLTIAGTATARTPHSAHQICVALVVDARALGAGVSTTCAKVPGGATGLDVLQAGGHRIGFRRDGLICTIDGLPKSGCTAVDDSHYWAYFHRAPRSTAWTYSTEGAATYQPANASTDGWVYDNGTSLTPDNIPYRKICPPAATRPSATASPTASASATPSGGSSRPTPRPTSSAGSSAGHGDRSPTASPIRRTVAPATSSPSPMAHPSPSASRSPGSAQPSHHATASADESLLASPAPSDSVSPTAVALTGSSGSGSSGSGSSGLPVALIAGIAAIAGVGALTAIRLRRSRPPS